MLEKSEKTAKNLDILQKMTTFAAENETKEIETSMQVLKVIKQYGWTLERMAEELGVTKGTFSVSINGTPNIKRLYEIANVLGCSPAEFFADWDTAPENRHEPKNMDGTPRVEASSAEEQPSEDAVEAASSSADEQSPSAGSERSSAGSEGQSPSEGQEREQGAEGLPFGNEEKEHTAHRPTALGMYACPYCGRGVTIEVKGV